MDGKRYIVIVGQKFSNPNSDETLLAEEHIEYDELSAYSHPMVFGSGQLIKSKDQLGIPLKIGICWYRYIRCLDDSPPTR